MSSVLIDLWCPRCGHRDSIDLDDLCRCAALKCARCSGRMESMSVDQDGLAMEGVPEYEIANADAG
jgi:transcription elongation factor Elf1